jgi:hypothetical protein
MSLASSGRIKDYSKGNMQTTEKPSSVRLLKSVNVPFSRPPQSSSDPIEEARRQLKSMSVSSRPTGKIPERSLEETHSAILSASNQLRELMDKSLPPIVSGRPTRGIPSSPIVSGRPTRGIPSQEKTIAPEILSAQRHLEILRGKDNQASSISKSTRGVGEDEGCLTQKAALNDLRQLYTNGGLLSNLQGDKVRITNGPGGTIDLDMMGHMIKHATHGCVENDPDFFPCAVCQSKFE